MKTQNVISTGKVGFSIGGVNFDIKVNEKGMFQACVAGGSEIDTPYSLRDTCMKNNVISLLKEDIYLGQFDRGDCYTPKDENAVENLLEFLSIKCQESNVEFKKLYSA